MTRFKPVGLAAGLLLGLAGITWHLDALVWLGIGVLGAVFVIRYVKRDPVGHD